MTVYRPQSIEELRSIMATEDKNLNLIAGGTDLVLEVMAHPEREYHLVDLTSIDDLSSIDEDRDSLRIGSTSTHWDLESSALVAKHGTALSMAAASVGSTQIRNRGTVGGNLGHGSAAADTVPALACLQATIEVQDCVGNTEWYPVGDFITGRNVTLLEKGQFIRSIKIPIIDGRMSWFGKVGSRRAVTISKINLAASFYPDIPNQPAKIYIGAIASSPTRALKAEEELSRLISGSGCKDSFLRALSHTVDSTIPGRSSLPYKREAIKGLGDQLWDHVKEVLR
nr:FAD binding domain-containing protein [uncultured Dethiosulfovibrio sp.]